MWRSPLVVGLVGIAGLVAVVAVAACRSRSATAQPLSAADDPCSPVSLQLASATPLVPWQPPQGCTLAHPVDQMIVRAQSDLDALLRCSRPVTAPPFDFSRASLLVASRRASRALIGLFALDDGTTITLVERLREPCPAEAAPPPVTVASWFAIAGSNVQRNFGTAQCTVPAHCK